MYDSLDVLMNNVSHTKGKLLYYAYKLNIDEDKNISMLKKQL